MFKRRRALGPPIRSTLLSQRNKTAVGAAGDAPKRVHLGFPFLPSPGISCIFIVKGSILRSRWKPNRRSSRDTLD